MKKVLFLLAVAVLFLQAQGFSQKTRVGVTAGITNANMYGTVDSKDLNDKTKAGFTAGVFLDAPIGKSKFSFQPSINYVQKGRVLSEVNKDKSWLALRYADVNLNFLLNSKGKTTFFIGLGPTVSFDLPSYKVSKTYNGTAINLNPDPEYSRSETKIKFGRDKLDDLKGLDYGANGLVGVRFRKGYYFAVNYTFGLRNIAAAESGDEINNAYVGFRLGYLFSNK